MNRGGSAAEGLVQLLGQQLHVRIGRVLAFVILGWMRFHAQLAASERHLPRLIDEPHFGADGNQREKRGYVLRVHAYATVGDSHTNGHRGVGPMNEIRAIARREAHGVVAQGIVRSWLLRAGREWISVGEVLLARALGWVPERMFFLL